MKKEKNKNQKSVWEEIKEAAGKESREAFRENWNVRNIVFAITAIIVALFVVITNVTEDEKPTPVVVNQQQETIPIPPSKPTFEDKTVALTNAELFSRVYFTYDTQSVERVDKLNKIVSHTLLNEIQEEDNTIRPTTSILTSNWVKTEDNFIQENGNSFIWTGNVFYEIKPENGQKYITESGMLLVIERSLVNPSQWLVTKVDVYGSD